MIFNIPNRNIDVFTVCPRSLDPERYWERILTVMRASDVYDYTGLLIFTGNDTFVEPWVVAQTVMVEAKRLEPLVAVNPLYTHPYTVAKLIASFAYVYQRRTWLNMVAGAALSYQQALGDRLPHEERYDRLREYMEVIKALLTQPRASYEGKHYQLAKVQLLPRVPPQLQPKLLLSGQSDPALKVADALGAVSMQMLPSTLAEGLNRARGVHLGIVARPSEEEAWKAAKALFPEDKVGQAVLELSMQNNDSEWKRRMKLAADSKIAARPGFWLDPFRNFQADCPYFVGSHAQAAELVAKLIRAGIQTIILDILPSEEEFQHVDIVFKQAAATLAAG